MATNQDFNGLINRITVATNTLESNVATINQGAANVSQAVAAAELAASQAQASQAGAAASASTATTQANTASNAATTATTQADRAEQIANDLLASAPFQEAPIDGQQYARQDGGWSVVTGGGGGGTVQSVNSITPDVNGNITLTATDVGAKPDSYVPTWTEVTGKPTVFPTNWTNVADKPTTFAPTIGTTADTALAGNTVIPTNTNQLTNGAGFVTAATAPVRSVAGKTGDVTLEAADIASGTFAPARLGTGTPTADLVLKGDGSWGSVPAPTGGFAITETVNYNGAPFTQWPTANPNESANGELLSSGAFTGIVAMIQSGQVAIRNAIPCGTYSFTTALSTANVPSGGKAVNGSSGIIQVFKKGPNKHFVAYGTDAFAAPDLGMIAIWKTNYWSRLD